MLMYTLGIFNRSTRNSAKAWTSLGSIPSFSKFEHKDADTKLIDYHNIVSFLLEEPRSLMLNYAGILFPIQEGHTISMRRLIPFVLCMEGDTLALNEHSSKKQSGSVHPCRSCQIHMSCLDSHQDRSAFVKNIKQVRDWRKRDQFSCKKVKCA